MLQTWMELKLFFYCMIGAGALGILTMVIVNKIGAKNIQDKTSYDKMTQKLKIIAITGGLLCTGITGLAVFGAFWLKYQMLTVYKYLFAGGCLVLTQPLACMVLTFLSREKIISDYLFTTMAGAAAVAVPVPERPPKTKSVKMDFKQTDLKKLDKKKPQNTVKPQPMKKDPPPDIEQSVDAILQGIRESAAGTVGTAGTTKYSRYLNPEEESLMRDIIKEYMT